MAHVEKVFEVVGVMLGLLMLVGILMTDGYTHGAEVTARSDETLMHLINNGTALCLNAATATHDVNLENQTVTQ